MSEAVEELPVIVSAKSEDKLEIEKEEAGEVKDEEAKDDEVKGEEDKAAEEGEGSDVTEKKDETAVEEGAEEKDSAEGEKKKFSLSQIKTPKIIKEIRSRSKSRDKKKVSPKAILTIYL